MKLWQKNAAVQADIERFTVGRDREMDLLLAPYDILGSLAHIEMLCSIGLLEAAELETLQAALKRLYAQTQAGNFEIEAGVEDVHSQVELMLTRELGDLGKKIHSGRSRNDQVLVDLRLFFRAEIEDLARRMERLFDTLQSLSEQYKEIHLPGYTHLQVAMVSSFGLWLGAFAESLVDDLRHLRSAYESINQNPLGSAAGYGSSFPLNRRMTTDLLGFADLNYNVVHAQMGRGKSELFLAFALAGLGQTLGKLSMDLVLYLNQNFAFLSFPEELTTGSSIMPHKKNPDVFELTRAKSNQLVTLPTQVSALIGNLPSGYHRDFQLLKENMFPALAMAKDCLDMLSFTLPQMRPKTDILQDEKYQYLYSVEEVNRLVLEGVPFRDAYKQVGLAIEAGQFNPDKNLNHTHEGSLGNLCTAEIKNKWMGVWAGFGFEKVAEKLGGLVKEGR
jgi:argininosuccinate lyase